MKHEPDQWETTAAHETLALGRCLGRCLVGGLTIGLVGPLGAGKTHFVKGVAIGNGLEDAGRVTSPTFTLVHEYPGRLRLHHLDAYRLESCAELLALGFDELAEPNAAVFVEWADRVRDVMPVDMLWIELSPTGETTRKLVFTATGELATRCLSSLRAAAR